MRLALLVFCFAILAPGASAKNLVDFQLTDQHLKARAYRFPKTKVTVMTIADHKGSGQLAPWIQQLHNRYRRKIDIDGVADVSGIPTPMREIFRAVFRNQLTYSVMLDWDGSVVRQFGHKKGVANIYVIDRDGRIVNQTSGPLNDEALAALAMEIDRTLGDVSGSGRGR